MPPPAPGGGPASAAGNPAVLIGVKAQAAEPLQSGAMAMPLRKDLESALSGSEAHAYLAPLFLGTVGENGGAFERALLEVVRDHMAWRRNFHPEDPPSVSAADQGAPSFAAAMERTRAGLHDLSQRLQRSAPMFSPRCEWPVAVPCSTIFIPARWEVDACPVMTWWVSASPAPIC